MLALTLSYPVEDYPYSLWEVPHAKHFTGVPAVHLWQSPPYLLLRPASQE